MMSAYIRKRKTKKKWMHEHSRQRAMERYDIFWSKRIEELVVAAIQRRNSLPKEKVRKQSNSRTIWRVMVDSSWLTVVYDKTRKCIITLLPDAPTVVSEHTTIPVMSDNNLGVDYGTDSYLVVLEQHFEFKQ